MTDDELKVRYLETGISLRKLGAELGLSDNGVRYRIRRACSTRQYNAAVTKVITFRITHARGRQLKHAIAMLRRHRPALYAQWLERTRPGFCEQCTRTIQARATSSWWRWKCDWCGTSGRVPLLL